MSSIDVRTSELRNFVFKDFDNPDTYDCTAPVTIEALLDALFALFEDCKSWGGEKYAQPTFVQRYEGIVRKLKSLRLNKDDFQIVKPLTTGQFGKVSIVKSRIDGSIYAMKVLNKLHVLRSREAAFFMEERNFMAIANMSQWIPTLVAAFQDDENLYLVMEYAAGGDFFSILDRSETSTITEEMARFYFAELCMAVAELHKLSYVHRDIKPQNILIDKDGHIKLADFGSCIRLDENGSVTSPISVGTADYISPEVLRAQEGNVAYGKECDWWSVGIVLYESLVGDPPFYSDGIAETYGKIMNHKGKFAFPSDVELSDQVKDLINRFLDDRSKRLGRNGLDEIKAHSFFKGVDWAMMRNQIPPFAPVLSSPDDISNFSTAEEQSEMPVLSPSKAREFQGNNLPFIGYTYSKSGHLYPSSVSTGTSQGAPSSNPDDAQRLKNAKAEVLQLQSRINEINRSNEHKKSTIAEDHPDTEIKKNATELARERSNLDRRITDLTRDLDAELKQKKESASQARQLRSELDSAKAELVRQQTSAAGQENKLAELKKNNTILELQIERLTRNINAEKSAKKDAEEELQGLETKLAKEVTKRNELMADKAKLEDLCNNRRAEIEQLKESIAAEIKKSNEHERKLADLRAEIQRENDSRALQERLAEERREASSNVAALTENKAVLEHELAELKRVRAKDIAEQDQLREKLVLKEQQYKGEERDRIDAERKCHAHELKISDLESKIQKQTTALKAAAGTVEELSGKLKDTGTEVSMANIEINNLVSLLQKEVAAREVAQAACAEAEKRCRAHEEDAQSKREDLERVTRELDAATQHAQSDAVQFLKEYDIVEAERRRIEADLTKTKKDLDDVKRTYESHEEEREQTKRDLELKQTQITTLTTKLMSYAVEEGYGITDQAKGGGKKEKLMLKTLSQQVDKLTKSNKDAELEIARLRKQLAVSDSPHSRPSTPDRQTAKSYDSIGFRSSFSFGKKKKNSISSSSEISADYHFSNDGLQGWLKFQVQEKSGKTSKGVFKKKFVIIKDLKLIIVDREKDLDRRSSGGAYPDDVTNIDLLCDVFQIRPVGLKELHHLAAKDVSCCFAISASNLGISSGISGRSVSHSETSATSGMETPTSAYSKSIAARQVQKLKEDITREEQIRKGAENLLRCFPDPGAQQHLLAKQQLDACNTRLHQLMSEGDRLASGEVESSTGSLCSNQASNAENIITEEQDVKIRELEKQLQKEKNIADAAKRVQTAHSTTNKGMKTPSAEADKLYAGAINKIAQLKLELERLKSGMPPTLIESQIFEGKGHTFKVHTYNSPTVKSCQHCYDALWGPKHQGLECTQCKMVVHRNCQPVVSIRCEDQQVLRNVKPYYFIASDEAEYHKWMLGIEFFRAEAERTKKHRIFRTPSISTSNRLNM